MSPRSSALSLRDRLGLAPHTVVRALCAYLGAVGAAVDAGSAWPSVDDTCITADRCRADLLMGAGIAMARDGRGQFAAAGDHQTCRHRPWRAILVTGLAADRARGASLLSLIIVAYSVAGARTVIAAGRKRLNLDAEARKALTFVDEFENSGRGWFWETNSEAPCPTSRSSSPTISNASRRSCSAASSPTCCRSTPARSARSTKSARRSASTCRRASRSPTSSSAPASDEDIHWSLSGNPIFDERGRFLGFRGIGTDLTEQRRSEQEISRLARFDSLTGLPNRALMRQTLDEALRNASRRQKGCALFLIDLDRFKNVNDTLGHPIGDALLRQVADRLKSVMGDHGQVGRLGGDEFKAVLPGHGRHRLARSRSPGP